MKRETVAIPPLRPTAVLVIDTGERKFYAHLADNTAAKTFFEKLESGPCTVDMQDFGNRAKVGALPFPLKSEDTPVVTVPGDLLLCEGNRITLCYDSGKGNFTKLAQIGNTTKEKLLDVLGDGNVTLRFYLEWSE